MKRTLQSILGLTIGTFASFTWAAEPGNDEGVTKADVAHISQPQFSPYGGRNYPTRVLWGDTGACKLQVERTRLRTASHRFGKNPQD